MAEAAKKQAYKSKSYESMSYPGQRAQMDVKAVSHRCIADPKRQLFQYTAIDKFTRLRFLAAYPEQSVSSSADFLQKPVNRYARRGILAECIQTGSGSAFTNRFPLQRRDLPTLLENTGARSGICHKLIRPYPRSQR